MQGQACRGCGVRPGPVPTPRAPGASAPRTAGSSPPPLPAHRTAARCDGRRWRARGSKSEEEEGGLTEQLEPVCLRRLPLEHLDADDKVPGLGREAQRAGGHRLWRREAHELERDWVGRLWVEEAEGVGEGEDAGAVWGARGGGGRGQQEGRRVRGVRRKRWGGGGGRAKSRRREGEDGQVGVGREERAEGVGHRSGLVFAL